MWKVLVVDDSITMRRIIINSLKSAGFDDIVEAGNGIEGLANMEGVELVLPDWNMPEMDGIEVAKIIKENKDTSHVAIIFLTADKIEYEDVAEGLNVGADDYLTKPFNHVELLARINAVLRTKRLQDEIEELNESLAQKVRDRTEEIERTRDVAIFGLAKLAEYRDPETGQHLERIRVYTKKLAETLQKLEKYKAIIDDKFIEMIYKSSPLHDIGKVGIPDNILLKPGKLTNEEFEIMKKHATIGGSAIAAAEKDLKIQQTFLSMGKKVAYFHHEKFDGTGYPHGIKGESIPIEARIMAIADVFDALVSKRVYKKAMSYDAAKKIILEGKGKHFDLDIVDAFIEIADEFKEIANKYADSE